MSVARMKHVALLLQKDAGADEMELIRTGISQAWKSSVSEDSGEGDCDKLRNIAQRIRDTEILIRTPAKASDNSSGKVVEKR